jgi:hypothetical protein
MAMMTKIRGVAANGAVLAGVGGGVAALALISNPVAKLFTCVLMFAAAAGSALRRTLFAPVAVLRAKAVAMEVEPVEYPYAVSNPWERSGAPLGL